MGPFQSQSGDIYPAETTPISTQPCMGTYVRMTSQGGAYSQFRRALARGNFIVAWGLAAEIPAVSLADALQLLLLARDAGERERFDRAAVRWHALLCLENRLSVQEAVLALSAVNALSGAGAAAAAHALGAVCDRHGLE